MVSSKRSIILFLGMCASMMTAHAQLINFRDLDTVQVFRNLDDAMQRPLEVIRLDLSKRKLSEIPDTVFTFSNLQELKLNKCRLTAVKDEFSQLQLLQTLEMGHNEIQVFPKSIAKLSHLRKLDLADNLIELVPDNIDELSNLETLALWDNPITYYPERLTEMHQLKVLDLLNNAMSRDTQERLKGGLPQCKIIMSPPCACMDGAEE